MKLRLFASLLMCSGMFACVNQLAAQQEKEIKMSGNPLFEGWYADPEGVVFGDKYWIFPTYSDHWDPNTPDIPDSELSERQRKTINKRYLVQQHLDAFSSPDLITWTKHPRVLELKNVSWGEYALWAPAIFHANDKYYLFFGANDIQNNEELGGIGVAVADRPEGPYKDAIGKPLISQIVNGAQPIDQFVFRDDDGSIYMYYGGWRHCNVVKLSDDLLSVVPHADGTIYKEVTPAKEYVEGPFMFKRNGKYYFMWSEGGWGGPNYCVAYAIADSPLGPFTREGKILQQDPTVATGAGHHSVINVPGTDEYYIVYHRRPLGHTNANHRVTCIDHMTFDENGKILPVKITFEGVPARPLKVK